MITQIQNRWTALGAGSRTVLATLVSTVKHLSRRAIPQLLVLPRIHLDVPACVGVVYSSNGGLTKLQVRQPLAFTLLWAATSTGAHPLYRAIPIADPIVMRYHPDMRHHPDERTRLQMLAWKRPDTQEWSIPGGMLQDGEDGMKAVLRILSSRLGNMATNSLECLLRDDADISGKIFYRGYSDDPRNTDNAWTEVHASLMRSHRGLRAVASQRMFQLPAAPIRAPSSLLQTTAFRFMNSNNLPFIEDNARNAAWIDMNMDDARFRNLYGFHRHASGMHAACTALLVSTTHAHAGGGVWCVRTVGYVFGG